MQIKGTVIKGRRLGRTIGLPTANLQPEHLPEIQPGVYHASVLVDDHSHDAVCNIGNRPTVNDDRPLTVEAHLLDFSSDLYGKEITVILLDFLRPEIKFDSLEELKNQINADIKQIKKKPTGLF